MQFAPTMIALSAIGACAGAFLGSPPSPQRRVCHATPVRSTVRVHHAPSMELPSALSIDVYRELSEDEAMERPVLLYLPGIEGTGYSLSRQTEELSSDFNVKWLTVPADDRTPFDSLVQFVRDAIEAESSPGGVYVVGESFGGVLALNVALGSTARPPKNLKGLVLINPATSVTESWPSTLPPLLKALEALPEGLSDAAYLALATPTFAAISGDPIRLMSRRGDEKLRPPERAAVMVGRMIVSRAMMPHASSRYKPHWLRRIMMAILSGRIETAVMTMCCRVQ